MLPPIRDNDRRFVIALATILCSSSIVLLPLTAQSARDSSADVALAASGVPLEAPAPLSFPAISVTRDPFASDAAAPESSASATAPLDTQNIVLPPNAGAGEDSPAPGSAVAVRAVVLGSQSRALVDFGSTVRVMAVGDVLSGAAIASIDGEGVTLSNGTHILLTQARP